jgi:hypothetical protein
MSRSAVLEREVAKGIFWLNAESFPKAGSESGWPIARLLALCLVGTWNSISPQMVHLSWHMRGFARYETLIKRNARYEVHSEMRLVLAVDQFGGKKSYRGATQK